MEKWRLGVKTVVNVRILQSTKIEFNIDLLRNRGRLCVCLMRCLIEISHTCHKRKMSFTPRGYVFVVSFCDHHSHHYQRLAPDGHEVHSLRFSLAGKEAG